MTLLTNFQEDTWEIQREILQRSLKRKNLYQHFKTSKCVRFGTHKSNSTDYSLKNIFAKPDFRPGKSP